MSSKNIYYLKNSGCHGGSLRNFRKKRVSRRLSNRRFHHIVFKVNRDVHPTSLRTSKTYLIAVNVIKTYSKRFKVRISTHSIQYDHIHLLIRTNRKSNYQNFFRVVAGQIAQRVTDTFDCVKFEQSFWRYRPFSRIVRSWKSYLISKAYIRLNELEGRKILPYQKARLKNSTPETWQLLKINPRSAGWIFYAKTIELMTGIGDRYPKTGGLARRVG